MHFTSAGAANYYEAALRGRIERLRAGGLDRGASAVEWVIITAVLITLVAVVAIALKSKIQSATDSLDLTNPAK